MLGPNNKVLEKDFLVLLIECLKKSNSQSSEDIKKIHRWSDFYDSFDTIKFYDFFIKQQNTLIYNGEIFKIVSIAISNTEASRNRTYKDAWKRCDTPNPSSVKAFETYHCSCEDNYESSDEENNEENNRSMNIYSIDKFLKEYADKITYNGTYYSQPGPYYPVVGAQYNWNLIFNYNEMIDGKVLDITVKLGPQTRNIFVKKITGYTGSPLIPIIKSGNEDVNSYKPNNLYFDSNFFPLIKIALLSREKIFEYSGVNYKIIDSKFCSVKSDVFACGCCHNMCKPMSKTEGIKKIPTQISYRDDITVSCTPEWFIQVQIGCCNGGSYCARFILECI
ncbi:hypothetical protein Klosneuvirus_6_65 [Klosneuvirus KNV1]|uniref:Uncharacterized protein n=1 Tax=Klosneuvirus KNV1 TaxID=1977640 RepID=A0A1V0SLB4_9VIRU|nr:hypothetical protein Klosneuvirus_6_65 [Klosneuvirus KNV1]